MLRRLWYVFAALWSGFWVALGLWNAQEMVNHSQADAVFTSIAILPWILLLLVPPIWRWIAAGRSN